MACLLVITNQTEIILVKAIPLKEVQGGRQENFVCV